MRIGTGIFGAAAIAFGIMGLASGNFASIWQPVPTDLPFYRLAAYLFAVLSIIGGIAINSDQFSRVGGWLLAGLFAAVCIPWLIRVAQFPGMIGTWIGFAEQTALVLAALVVASDGKAREGAALRWARLPITLFGICAVIFGLGHFLAPAETAAMVPAWIIPGRLFWALATGAFHVAAGLALISGISALLAARLLGVMMLLFGAFVWLPQLVASPQNHLIWAGNIITVALAGASFVIADAIARRANSKPLETNDIDTSRPIQIDTSAKATNRNLAEEA